MQGIIAEIGINHNGDLDLAKKMALQAAEKGAIVKFQAFKAEELYPPGNLREMFKQWELSKEEFREIYDYLVEKLGKGNFKFGLSIFDLNDLDYYAQFCDFFKIASPDMIFFKLIEELLKYGKEVVISVGASTKEEIDKLWDIVKEKKDKVTLMHCVSAYPTKYEDTQLGVIKFLKRYTEKVGFSDHTLGIEASVLALSLGAKLIEKHFTLDKNMDGPDQKLSVDPSELEKLIKWFAFFKKNDFAIKEEEKVNLPSEDGARRGGRRVLYLRKDKRKGETLKIGDFYFWRDVDGIFVSDLHTVCGKKMLVDKREGEKLNRGDFD